MMTPCFLLIRAERILTFRSHRRSLFVTIALHPPSLHRERTSTPPLQKQSCSQSGLSQAQSQSLSCTFHSQCSQRVRSNLWKSLSSDIHNQSVCMEIRSLSKQLTVSCSSCSHP